MRRGQVTPVWIGAVLMALTAAFFLISYGNMMATQVRAQSAADSIASAAVAMQSQDFNQMLTTLYATGVEEYRLRHITEALRTTAMHSGGCNAPSYGQIPCATVWSSLVTEYQKSLYRYKNDTDMLSRITGTMSQANLTTDVNSFVTSLNNGCGNPSLQNHLSCGLNNMKFYVITAGSASGITFEGPNSWYPSNLQSNRMDALNIVFSSYDPTDPTLVQSGAAPNFWPMMVQIGVCAPVPPVLPWFNNAQAAEVYATSTEINAMVEQDWLQPGTTTNPDSGQLYQPVEAFGSVDAAGLQNWYSVDYGNSLASTQWSGSVGSSFIGGTVNNEEFLARVGWWAPVPILPLGNAQTVLSGEAGCNS